MTKVHVGGGEGIVGRAGRGAPPSSCGNRALDAAGFRELAARKASLSQPQRERGLAL